MSPRPGTVWLSVACALVALSCAAAMGRNEGAAAAQAAAPVPVRYRVGVNTGWAPNVGEPARIAWAFDTGATMPRIGMAMDQFRANPGHPDACVKRFVEAGRTGLAFLFNGGGEVKLPDGSVRRVDEKPPDGLWEPVFADGADTPGPAARLNPANEWASFVGGIVERYDGDGGGDAPGSPRLAHFSLYNEPDYLDWPQRPTDPAAKTMRNWLGRDIADLARLLFVSRAAARFANPNARVGAQVCFPETLGFLLDDTRHPAAGSIDFVDYHAYASPGSDTLVERKDGLLPVLAGMRAEFTRRGLKPPLFVCSEVGYPGDPAAAAVQRAAAAKVQIAAACQPDLLTAQWYALFDPSWTSMGLVADVTGLPPDGRGHQPKDSFYAMRTAAALLGPMAVGRMRFVERLEVGDAARAVRFEREGQPFVALWAADFTGDATLRTTARLALPAGRYAVLHWDWSLTGEPASLLETRGAAVEVAAGTDPVYVVGYAGSPPSIEPVTRPPKPAPPPWKTACSASDPQYPPANGYDGSYDTQWVGGYGSRSAWWQVTLDEAVTAASLRVKLGQLAAGITCVAQVSDDGTTWRDVSAPFTSPDWSTQTVQLLRETRSRHWRLLFALPSDQVNAGLFEIEMGGAKAKALP